MKIIDIDILATLNKDLYFKFYKESIKEIESFYKLDSNDFISKISIAFIPFFSRDPSLTNVFSLNTKFKLLIFELIKYDINDTIIIVDNCITKKCLINYFNNNNIDGYKIKYKEFKFKTYIILLINILISFISFYLKLFKNLLFKIILNILNNKSELSEHKKIILIDTFYSAEIIKNKSITDRYHTFEFYDELNSTYKNEKLFIFPEIHFYKLNILDILFLKKSHPNILLKFEFLTFRNYLKCFFLPIKYLYIINYKNLKNQHNHYLYKYIFWENLLISPKLFIHIQNYFALENLKKNNIQITAFYNWWENQPIDKVLNISLNQFHKNTNRVGIISYIVDMDINNHLIPSYNEYNLNLLPNHFLIWSLYYGNKIQEKSPFFEYNKLVNNRFSYLYNCQPSKYYDEKCILVMLPLDINTTTLILDYIQNFILENKNFKFLIKSHPSSPKKISSNFFNDNIFIYNQNTILNTNFKLTISSNSSASMESILSYKYLIIVNLSSETYNILSEMVPKQLFSNVSSYQNFKTSILYYMHSNIHNDLNLFISIRNKILL